MKIVKSLIGAVLLFSCQAEEKMTYPEYHRAYNEIIQHSILGETDMALEKFEKLHKRVEHVPSYHYFSMALTCAQNDLCDLSATYLEKALENGMVYRKGMETNEIIGFCEKEITSVLKKESAIHKKRFNYEYQAQINKMFQEDQNARNQGLDIGVTDSLNMIKLLEQIDEYGFPSEQIIGEESALNALFILLHMDRDRGNKVFKPILDEALFNGELSPMGYAWIVDRRRVWGREKLEPYYYHLLSPRIDELSLEEKIEIDRRRDSIGLELQFL